VKKILNMLFIAAIGISFNGYASTMQTLGGFDTVVLDDTEIAAQSGTAGSYSIDPIIAYTLTDNSGDATEMAWMAAVYDYLGILDTVSNIAKIEFGTEAISDVYWTDLGDSNYTGDLNYGNDNYLIKIGGGKVDYDTFLYQNLDSLFQATLNLETLAGFSGFTGNTFDIYRISHISEVPVPAAFWLFGTALIGLVGFGKRRKAT
jgi:hypothetical protein